MIFEIARQERYSRGELLLRSIFGPIYIALPHALILSLIGIAAQVLGFISFWAILFTGRYPESFFEFQVKYFHWNTRVNARLYNLCDGYPAFGMSVNDPYVRFEVPYPESLSRGHALLKAFFGPLYCALPHVFVLYFRIIATAFLQFLAFWAVLFTGEYPESWHRFNTGTLRWGMRLNLYLGFMTDKYPPFTGQRLPDEIPPEETAQVETNE